MATKLQKSSELEVLNLSLEKKKKKDSMEEKMLKVSISVKKSQFFNKIIHFPPCP